MKALFFLDLGIYPKTEDAFNRRYAEDLEKYWLRLESTSGHSRDSWSDDRKMSVEQHFWETYGGPWRFNQAVGWLRLFTCPGQIRGEPWRTAKNRVLRRSRRDFRWEGKAFELLCDPTQSSADIARNLDQELLAFQKDLRPRTWVLDRECFDSLARHVDWRALVWP